MSTEIIKQKDLEEAGFVQAADPADPYLFRKKLDVLSFDGEPIYVVLCTLYNGLTYGILSPDGFMPFRANTLEEVLEFSNRIKGYDSSLY